VDLTLNAPGPENGDLGNRATCFDERLFIGFRKICTGGVPAFT
jgi:hypothetical protein